MGILRLPRMSKTTLIIRKTCSVSKILRLSLSIKMTTMMKTKMMKMRMKMIVNDYIDYTLSDNKYFGIPLLI